MLLQIQALQCRSREGAWIEIDTDWRFADFEIVAPVRERGLKYSQSNI